MSAASALCLLSVVIGALMAHALKAHINASDLAIMDTATKYLFMHALAMFCLSVFTLVEEKLFVIHSHHAIKLFVVQRFFALGIVCFSGSLYLLVLLNTYAINLPKAFYLITPFGGLLLITAWFLLFTRTFSIWRSNRSNTKNSVSS